MKTPSGWIKTELGRVIQRTELGGNYLGSRSEVGVPLIKMGNMGRGRFDVREYERLPRSLEISPRDHLRAGDLLLNTRNSLDLVGKVAMWRGELPEAVFNSNIMRLVPDGSMIASTAFLNSLLNSEPKLRAIRRRATGTTSVAAIYWRDLESLPLTLPSPVEQTRIADILGTWDEALEKLDALIAAKQRSKQGLMQQLLTGKRRLSGYAKPWSQAKLGELFTSRTETNRPDLPLLSITADQGVVPRDTLEKRDTSSEDKSKYLRIAPGDIGYNTMRMWQGVSALSALEGIVSPAYTICTPTNQIDGRFAAHFFKLPHTVSLFHRYSQGLVDDTLNLKFPSFAVIEVSIPTDVAEQTAIADILDAADAELYLLHDRRAALDEQKRGLMQQLLTGKLRVNAA